MGLIPQGSWRYKAREIIPQKAYLIPNSLVIKALFAPRLTRHFVILTVRMERGAILPPFFLSLAPDLPGHSSTQARLRFSGPFYNGYILTHSPKWVAGGDVNYPALNGGAWR